MENSQFLEQLAEQMSANNPSFLAHVLGQRPGLALFIGGAGAGKEAAMEVAAEMLRRARPETTFLHLNGLQSPGDYANASRDSEADVIVVAELPNGHACLDVLQDVRIGRTVWAGFHSNSVDEAFSTFKTMMVEAILQKYGNTTESQALLVRVQGVFDQLCSEGDVVTFSTMQEARQVPEAA